MKIITDDGLVLKGNYYNVIEHFISCFFIESQIFIGWWEIKTEYRNNLFVIEINNKGLLMMLLYLPSLIKFSPFQNEILIKLANYLKYFYFYIVYRQVQHRYESRKGWKEQPLMSTFSCCVTQSLWINWCL